MSFLLSDHNKGLQVDVNNDQQFVVARLKEEVFDIAKENVCCMSVEASDIDRSSTYQSSEIP